MAVAPCRWEGQPAGLLCLKHMFPAPFLDSKCLVLVPVLACGLLPCCSHSHFSCRNRGLTGSLFWRWDVQVYAGAGPTDYGVRHFDSTVGLIGRHADTVRRRNAGQPPRAECGLGCWVPQPRGWYSRGCASHHTLTSLSRLQGSLARSCHSAHSRICMRGLGSTADLQDCAKNEVGHELDNGGHMPWP